MNPMHGLLLVNKPSGITSHDVVYRARRILGLRNIGHAGTLDPLASGLLILLIGEGTKISDYLLNAEKGYEVTARLGRKTDSMDITGNILAESDVKVTPELISQEVLALQGRLSLAVPVHSAVKVDGRRLYEFAHRGQQPEKVPVREMNFYDLRIQDINRPFVTVGFKCSKGSFVRAWVNDLGEKLGCGACVENLHRTYSQPFDCKDAIALEELESRWSQRQQRHGSSLGSAWIPLKNALPHFRQIDLTGYDEFLLKNGQISAGLKSELLRTVEMHKELPPVRVVSRETEDLLAILTAEPGHFYKIRRGFHIS